MSTLNDAGTFVLEYELSEEELVSFLSESFARSRLYRYLWPQRRFAIGLSFIAVMIAGSFALGKQQLWSDWHMRFWAAALFGALIFALSALDPLITSWLLGGRIRTSKYTRYLRPLRLEITRDFVRVSDKLSGDSREWPSVVRVQTARAGFVILLPSKAAILVPRRAFDDETAFVYFRNAIDRLGRKAG
jgi:hypothetical protein